MRRLVVAVVLLAGLGASPQALPQDAPASPAPALRTGARLAPPLYGTLLRLWDAPPDDPYAPGHRGVDVGAPQGTPVHASAEGVVSFAGSVAGNRTVTVDHGDGLRTTYSYLSSIAVAAGQRVARGTVVGTVGAGHPGSGLGPHVHLSVRRDGVYADPLPFYLGDDHADLLALEP